MNAKFAPRLRILLLRLVISALVLMSLAGNTTTAEASEASAALAGFVKISPANTVNNQPVSLTLKWSSAPSNPYGHTRYYKYCYYTSGGTCNFTGVLSTTQFNISGLTKGTLYYWQVQVVYCKDSRCLQKEKHEADNGQVWSFRTGGTEPPGSFAKLSPANGSTNLTSSSLSWAASPGATGYQICYSPSNNDNACGHLNGWRDVGNVTAYAVPNNDPKFIWGNSYYWQVRAYNAGGTRQASDGIWWSFSTSSLVGKATLVSPSGAISGFTPTYTWNSVSGVAWYYLWVNGPTGNVIKQWYQASSACSGGTCSATPSVTLGVGNYTWWVQTWNSSGYGPWSNGMSFNTVAPPVPGAATLVSPNGAITDTTPTYTWNSVSGATWFYLWVSKVNGDGTLTTIHTQWYETSLVCSGANCSVTPAGITLSSGNYRWWIQTWNNGGYGPWSSAMNFSLP